MRLHFLGGAREVGRSSILLESTQTRILLDCGIKVRDEEMGGITGYPKLPPGADAAIVSHCHLDHSGLYPEIVKRFNCPIFATPPTFALAELLAKDAKKVSPDLPYTLHDVAVAARNFILLPYNFQHTFQNVKFELRNAGHTPGSAMIVITVDRKKVVYTGDFKIGPTRLQHSAVPIENVDVLIIESTYAFHEHPNRRETEQKLMQKIEKVLKDGGNVLLPAFAVGRTQEIAVVSYTYDVTIPLFIAGMGSTVNDILLGYPDYVKDAPLMRAAIKNLRYPRHWQEPLQKPSAIISTAGMLEGGPAIRFLLALHKRRQRERTPDCVILTGFCLPETNAWFLLNKQLIHMRVKKTRRMKPVTIDIPTEIHHLSAHADRKDLLALIKAANPEKIICIHGDRCEDFATELKEMGYAAYAPKKSEVIEI